MTPIPCPVSAEELRRLVHGEKLTDDAIASLLGGTNHRVQSWRRRYGIEAVARWARHDVPPIEGRLKSLLVGSMLGDGRIVRRHPQGSPILMGTVSSGARWVGVAPVVGTPFPGGAQDHRIPALGA